VTNTFNVTKATASVTLTNLNQTYNGTPRVVTAATLPAGMKVDITYNGNAWAPTNPGSYAVLGIVNDAMFQGLDLQQTNLQNDAAQLQLLQSQAGNADGQMKAIQAGNQLASGQSNQLLQIRSLMMTQQNAIATKMQADPDREAQYAAASEQLRMGTFKKSTVVNW